MRTIALATAILLLISGVTFAAPSETIVNLETETGTLEGTLLVPQDQKDAPVALIIAGSGPTDRDGNNATMKNNTLKKLAWSLDNLQFEVTMPEDIRSKAETALRRMLEVSWSLQGSGEEQEKLEMAGVRAKGCGCG